MPRWECLNILIVVSALGVVTSLHESKSKPQQSRYSDQQYIQLFQEYIQIDTTTDNDLTPAVEFWRELSSEENVSFNVYEYNAGYPVVVIRWPGRDSSLPSIMLNSHMDVVRADEADGWTYPPFSGELVNGEIWGRGTQDMKSVSIQHYAAMKRLREDNVQLLRDVYITLVPDEEVGSPNGMNPFLASEEFSALGVGIDLDEGGASPGPVIPLLAQDKVVWQIRVDCFGTSTHGSNFAATNDTATGQCFNVMKSLFDFREQEYAKYLNGIEGGMSNPAVYTSVNLNKISTPQATTSNAGNNVVPDRVTLVYDMRLSTTLDVTLFEKQLNDWITQAGPNVTLTFLEKDTQSPATVTASSNPYYVAIQQGAANANIKLVPVVPSGSTDARFVRLNGYPAFGMSPMPNTERLLHRVNERLSVQTFLDGIKIYESIITQLANIPGDKTMTQPSYYNRRTAPK